MTATNSRIEIAGPLWIAPESFPDITLPAITHGEVSLVDSSLSVGAHIEIGAWNPDSIGRLSLTNSTATVGTQLLLGKNANGGTLFGESTLHVDASLLAITGDLRMDAGAAPGLETFFGVGGTTRGLGGYGAIDAGTASLAGLLTVDFSDLDLFTLGSGFDFDLIFAVNGFARDFDSVGFANLGSGYFVRSYGVVDVDDGAVWRVTLAAAQVPVPATLPLLLIGLIVGAAGLRARMAGSDSGDWGRYRT